MSSRNEPADKTFLHSDFPISRFLEAHLKDTGNYIRLSSGLSTQSESGRLIIVDSALSVSYDRESKEAA
jgi:hypothetical protein